MPGLRAASFLALPLFALLAGCSLGERINSTVNSALGGPAAPASGLAVGDEPYAVKTGTAILSEGGSAADAVTAMFFTMTATYPVAAGLGGGGICLVSDPVKGLNEFDFLPRQAIHGGRYAVPGAVKGFYDLQAKFGALPWARDVAAGEAFAGSGFPISHDLAIRLTNEAQRLARDPALAGEFLNAGGRPKAEGTIVANPALAESLAQIRLSGADGFYKGAVADQVIRSALAQGGAFSAADFSGARTRIGQPRSISEGSLAVALPSAQTGSGAFAASLLANAPVSSDPGAAVANAIRQSLARFGITRLPADLGGTGFAATDRNGQVAVCGVTLNGAFGAGVSAGRTGVLLANAPNAPEGIAGAFLAPVIARDGSGKVVLAGAGAGGPNGVGAIAYALLRLASGAEVDRPQDLRSTGAAPAVTANVISCQNVCVALPDPGGHGLGSSEVGL